MQKILRWIYYVLGQAQFGGSTLLDVMSWNLHLETDFCAIWLEFSLEEVENNDKLVLMVFYIL